MEMENWWEKLEGKARDKFQRVFEEPMKGFDSYPIYARKFGRKTVFAKDSGVIRLYIAGSDGVIYSAKLMSFPNDRNPVVHALLQASVSGLCEDALKLGVYSNGRLSA